MVNEQWPVTSKDGRKRERGEEGRKGGRMEGKTVTSGQWLLRRKTGRREEEKTSRPGGGECGGFGSCLNGISIALIIHSLNPTHGLSEKNGRGNRAPTVPLFGRLIPLGLLEAGARCAPYKLYFSSKF